MNITSSSFRVLDNKEDSFIITSSGDLTSSVTDEIREAIIASSENKFSTVYLDLRDVSEMDLSGANEIINAQYLLKQSSKKMILVYKKGSSVEKWVETTGLDKFVETAIVV